MRNKNKNSGRLLNFIVILLLAGVVGGYVFVVNNSTIKGFKARELEKKVQALKETNDKFKLKVAETQSITNLQNKISAIQMVPVDKFEYVAAVDSVMAKK